MPSGLILVVMGIVLAAQARPAAAPLAPSPASAPTAAELSAYHAVFLTLGPAWVKDRSARDQPGIQEHGQYMSTLSEAGKIVLGGPFLEGETPGRVSGAMVMFATTDPQEARRLMEADPGVKAGLFEIGEVRRLYVATGSWRPWKRSP